MSLARMDSVRLDGLQYPYYEQSRTGYMITIASKTR